MLSRLPALEDGRLGGHTGGNLLLSMMEQYSGDFLAAVDSLRALLDCNGRVWPVSVDHASVCAEYEDGSSTSGEVAVDAEQIQGRRIQRIWLDPEVNIHPLVVNAFRVFDAVVIGPGSFYNSLMPILLVQSVADELRRIEGPVVLVTNLLTEGRGMRGFSAGEAVRRVNDAIGRPVKGTYSTDIPPSTRSCYRSERCPKVVRWSPAASGWVRSPATPVGGSPMRCGACWPIGCSAGRDRRCHRRLVDAAVGHPRGDMAVCFAVGRRARIMRVAFSIVASIYLLVPRPVAGRPVNHTSGMSSARISSKSPSLFTLSGANSAMSIEPDQKSRCLIRS